MAGLFPNIIYAETSLAGQRIKKNLPLLKFHHSDFFYGVSIMRDFKGSICSQLNNNFRVSEIENPTSSKIKKIPSELL